MAAKRLDPNLDSEESNDSFGTGFVSGEIPSDNESDYEDNSEADFDSSMSSGSSSSDTADDTLPHTTVDHHSTRRFSNQLSESATLKAKSGRIWSIQPPMQARTRAANILTERAGHTRLALFQSFAAALDLFITPIMKDIIICETNRYAERVYQAAHLKNPQTTIGQWKHLDEIEFDSFVGLLLLAGVYRSCHESLNELWSSGNGRPIFRATMRKNRFEQILQFCRFDNKLTRQGRQNEDKLAAIRDIWELFIAQLRAMYRPGADLTLDEQLVPCRVRCAFRQYIPSKPGKYGIKIFWMCDSVTSYPLHGEVYLGRQPRDARQQNVAAGVVKRLSRPWRNTGRNITMDNFFTDVPLAIDLMQDRLTVVGTLRHNKRDIPEELKATRRRELYSSMFCFSDSLTIASYVPKRNKAVLMLSTMHHDSAVEHESPHKKPHIISYFNSTKGGVDSFDQMVRTYSCKRKTNRWPMVVFFNMLDAAALAAFVVWVSQYREWNEQRTHRRRLFLTELGMTLVSPEIQRRVANPRAFQKGVRSAFFSLGLPHRRAMMQTAEDTVVRKQRCSVCPREADRKVKQRCCLCSLAVCSKHSAIICEDCVTGLDE